jgi:hypothetical protein
VSAQEDVMNEQQVETREFEGHPEPDPGLRALDRLVGTWRVSGGAQGEVRFEWLEGGWFLVQGVDLVHDGRRSKGMEVIGRERGFGAPAPAADITSRYFDDQGNTFDYVYDLDGDTLTIWGGERGSPAFYRGTFSDGGDVLSGAWVYPGGGYESTAVRIR